MTSTVGNAVLFYTRTFGALNLLMLTGTLESRTIIFDKWQHHMGATPLFKALKLEKSSPKTLTPAVYQIQASTKNVAPGPVSKCVTSALSHTASESTRPNLPRQYLVT